MPVAGIRIPFIGIGFQTSTLGWSGHYDLCRSLFGRNKENVIDFKQSILNLWLPVAIVLILILPANFSTTAIIFVLILVLTFLGGYPLKYLASIVGLGILVLPCSFSRQRHFLMRLKEVGLIPG